MDTPPVDNQTDFEVHPQLLLTPSGDRLAVIIKATFEVEQATGRVQLASHERVRSIRHADEPWEKPEVDSIKYPCDVAPEKPGTDVIVVATAYAPGKTPVPTFDAYARIGAITKAVRIHGLRVWESGGAGISSPRPIAQLDVRYDYAWGGRDDSNPEATAEEPRNPVGRGVARNFSDLTHQLAPQIEDPDQPVKTYRTRPQPGGLCAIGRSFSPRRDAAGTHDAAWEEFRCPLPPKDQRPEFHQSASPGMVALPHLIGGEACALLNLHPSGALQFELPRVTLSVHFDVKNKPPEHVRPTLNTVLIDTWIASSEHPALIEMTWVATTKAPRKMLQSLTTIVERSASERSASERSVSERGAPL